MRLSGEERQVRDTLVLNMFLAGVTYRRSAARSACR